MCGIMGYVGDNEAVPVLLNGLKRLEYRGYDSAGIAVFVSKGIELVKEKGRLARLEEKINQTENLSSCVGIAHTRWATHGAATDINAHPHRSETGMFCVVHNGIIENYAELKDSLKKKGYHFESDTDTQVIAQILEDNYHGDIIETMTRVLPLLEGSYALGILCKDFPDAVICARNSSPLVAGFNENGCYLASDANAILEYTNQIYRFEDGEFAVLQAHEGRTFNEKGEPVEKDFIKLATPPSFAEKGGYEHFMLKEIMEQPDAIRNTVSSIIDEKGEIKIEGLDVTDVNKIYIIGCGSAYHVGVVGKYLMDDMLGVPVQADIASEFRYAKKTIDENTLIVIISQSGETADTLAALRLARKKGARVVSIVNAPNSSIARESDCVIFTKAGQEIAVATTKAYSAQLAVMYLLVAFMAGKMKSVSEDEIKKLIGEVICLPEKINQIFEKNIEIEKIAADFYRREHAYYIGRQYDYAAAMECSLKLKEISYIHSEAYAAGELKHGTVSLIEDGTLVIAMCCGKSILKKTHSNIKEVKARGARVICVTHPDLDTYDVADRVITIPNCDERVSVSLEVIPMQLFSYFVAHKRGCDIDKPKNLAKSVTVE